MAQIRTYSSGLLVYLGDMLDKKKSPDESGLTIEIASNDKLHARMNSLRGFHTSTFRNIIQPVISVNKILNGGYCV